MAIFNSYVSLPEGISHLSPFPLIHQGIWRVCGICPALAPRTGHRRATSAMPGCDISTGCCWWSLEHFQMLRSLGRSRKIWEHLGGWCCTVGFRCVFDVLFDVLIIEKQDRYMRRSNVRMLKSASWLTCTGEGEGYVRFRLKRRLSPILHVCGMCAPGFCLFVDLCWFAMRCYCVPNWDFIEAIGQSIWFPSKWLRHIQTFTMLLRSLECDFGWLLGQFMGHCQMNLVLRKSFWNN